MDPQFEELARRLAGDVDGRFLQRIEQFEKRAQVYMEELRSTVKLAAEGYGATLERIDRQLADLNAKVDTKFGDHDTALLDHASRIKALERRG